MLLKYESLFDGTLGDWNQQPISIEVKEGAKPYHGRPYPIPQIQLLLVSIGVMKRQSSSQLASSTFIIPKKDMTVWTITDFRELNKWIMTTLFDSQKQHHTVGARSRGSVKAFPPF